MILNLTDKIDLQRGEKSISLSNLSIYYTWKNIKGSNNNGNFKISVPTWNDIFELPDGSYSISDIQDYFEYIFQIDNPSIKLYINNIENRVKMKTGYYLVLSTSETMKLLESTENKLTKDKNDENVAHLEIIEVVLVHYNIVSNDYQHDSRVSYAFVFIRNCTNKFYLFKNI